MIMNFIDVLVYLGRLNVENNIKKIFILILGVRSNNQRTRHSNERREKDK